MPSDLTALVENVNDDPTGAVMISGTATEDQNLNASNTLADEDGIVGDISYQWKRGSDDIPNATGTTYTLVQDDVGKKISVVASYKDAFDNEHSVPSDLTDPVASAVMPGDVNNDAAVNNLDITPFIDALRFGGKVNDATKVAKFLAVRPTAKYANADANKDGSVNNLDITPFIDRLRGIPSASASHAAAASVQRVEPLTAILATAAVRRPPLSRPAAYTHPLGDTASSDTIETVDIFAGL